jgi:hypothetical protein
MSVNKNDERKYLTDDLMAGSDDLSDAATPLKNPPRRLASSSLNFCS